MSRACLQIQKKRGKTMTVNMLSIVCVFHSFFTFFIESALACRLFCVLSHFIYRFSSFSLLKSTVSQLQSSSSFMFLLGGFFMGYERPTFEVCSGFDTFAIVFCSPVLVHLRKCLVITEF